MDGLNEDIKISKENKMEKDVIEYKIPHTLRKLNEARNYSKRSITESDVI